MRATKFEWLEAIKSPTGDHTNISGLAIQRAFDNHRMRNRFVPLFCYSRTEVIFSAFFWTDTPEGSGFWIEIKEFNRNN